MKEININIPISFLSEDERNKIIIDDLNDKAVKKEIDIMTKDYNNEINKIINEMIKERKVLNEKNLIVKYLTNQIFEEMEYKNIYENLKENENIKICGFIEIINEELKENKILFYYNKFNKFWIDKYNRTIFDKNKNKMCIIDYDRELKNSSKKYKIYTYDIFINSDENSNFDKSLYELNKNGVFYDQNRKYYNKYKFVSAKLLNIDVSNLTEEIKENNNKLKKVDDKIKEKMNINNEVEFKSQNNIRTCKELSLLFKSEDKNKKINVKLSENEIYYNEIYYISQIKVIEYKNKLKYIFKIRNDNNIFKSNEFFEIEIL